MSRIEKTVFISYRRTNIYTALAIHQNLTHRGYDVFFDYESIKAGDFEQIIMGSIESRAHFVAILTPSALERCTDPNDWLYLEIEHALKHKRNIIPLTFEGFDFDDISRYLPPHIAKPLARHNALEIPRSALYFNSSMDFLVEYMNIPLNMVLHPPIPAVKAEEARQQQAIIIEPTVPESKMTAQRYFELGLEANTNTEKIKLYDRAIELNPQYAEAYYNRGVIKNGVNDIEGAIEDYNKAIQYNPYDSDAYYNRAIIKDGIGDLDGAIDDFSWTIQIKSDDIEAYYYRANLLYNKDYKKEAISDYTKIIKINPNLAEAYYNRGFIKDEMGDLNGAIYDYNYAIKINPYLVEAYINRGLAKYNKGDTNGAIHDYKQALKIDPEDQTAKNNLAIARKKRGF